MARTYYMVYDDGINTRAIPCGKYEDARELLARTLRRFHSNGATVNSHNDCCANLTANGVAITLTIYNF